ncbi:MAG: DNA polymerase III subunit gamma/tau [bacterium]|nr:DNA polymerase III subunit gamma/tau [bacterium]
MAPPDQDNPQYRVLARKYRPQTLGELRGQDVLVRTLTHAVETGRIAQAFLLTGIRGVGKTTTARVLARMLNCVGENGTGGVTAEPCGVCEHCVAIAADRHIDVLEVDAASHTGIDNMRSLLDAARYRPSLGRYKVYVMDEVHMLSGPAFNALLKTLEEPPEHLKFVFATTELRKIPATILSRCQRFDLRRIDAGELARYFGDIASREQASATDEALALIARAADGSVRDGFSILDQAIAQGRGTVTEDDVRAMLGLADRGRTFALYRHVMAGRIADALEGLAEQYASGVDPVVVLEDLLELTHWLTRCKVTPDAARQAAPEFERTQGAEMAETLGVPHLTRAWQILLKGIGEARVAPDSLQAVEMTLVRLAFSATLPTPEQALKALQESTPPAPAKGSESRAPAVTGDAGSEVPQSFEAVLDLVERRREAILHSHLRHSVHLVSFAVGNIEIRLGKDAPRELPSNLARLLGAWTGMAWQVTPSTRDGAPTIALSEEQEKKALLEETAREPDLSRILEAFPGAEIVDVRDGDKPHARNGNP